MYRFKEKLKLTVITGLTSMLLACGGQSSDNSSPTSVEQSTSSPQPTQSPQPEDENLSSCLGQTSNSNASDETQAMFNRFRSLTCDTESGVLSGQNVGHGDQIIDEDNVVGYAWSVGRLSDRDGVVPAVLGLDYEHDQIFSEESLTIANNALIEHANLGGIITINWSPISPWLNDASSLEDNPGVWLDTRSVHQLPPGNAEYINLAELLDENSEVGQVWNGRLDMIAKALTELRDNGAVVLWRPLQEMNGAHFWWGANEPFEDASAFIALWRDMHNYFSEEKGLDNLLWVYSPSVHGASGREAMWGYPGDEYVDVIAPTSYSALLDIPMYDTFRSEALTRNKVLGMAEYGPPVWGAGHEVAELDAPLTFDATRYARLLNDFSAVAYWVSWHSYYQTETEVTRLSLSDSLNTDVLFSDPNIITR